MSTTVISNRVRIDEWNVPRPPQDFAEKVAWELEQARLRALECMEVSPEDALPLVPFEKSIPGSAPRPRAKPPKPPRVRRKATGPHVRWARPRIIAAAWLWAARHGGEPPRSKDWAVTNGGQNPNLSTVLNQFGKWSDMIEQAGFDRPARGGSRKKLNKTVQKSTLAPSGTIL